MEGVISLDCEAVSKNIVRVKIPVNKVNTHAKTGEALMECCSRLGESDQ